MGSVDPQNLAALPGLFRALMAAPLRPLNRGFLPDPDALYILYQDQEPVRVGSPPHIDETALRSSVRARVSIQIGHNPLPAAPPRTRADGVVQARWLRLESPLLRLMLETYVGQKLGLSVSHPRLIAALSQAPASVQRPANAKLLHGVA